jgi:alpha-glucuronidase
MAFAEDGSQLWLRYPVNPKPRNIVNSNSKSPTIEIAKKELNQHWAGQAVDLKIDRFPDSFKDGYKIVSTPKKSAFGKNRLRIVVRSYHLLNLQQQKANFSNLKLEEKPSYDVRILNHWDNLDGTIERGYAGHSLWKWEDLPNKISPR